MRLLNVSAFFEAHRGGVEIVAGRLTRALAGRGLGVTWLSTSVVEAPLDVATIAVPACNIAERRLGFPWPIIGPKGLGVVSRAAGEHDAILIHDCLYPISIAAFAAARARRRPVLIVQHVGEVPYRNPVLRLLMRLANRIVARPMLARADQVVFISRVTSAHFHDVHFRRPPEHVFNGVDDQIFRPPSDAAEKTEARIRFDLPTDRPVILFVGRFVEKKGLAILREAVAARSDLWWAFAGWGPEDPASWGASNVSVFQDLSGTRLAELYRAADVFVLPSVGEGFPLVVQEALACGLPVVCGAETATSDEMATPYLLGVDLAPDVALDQVLEAVERARLQSKDDRAQFARGRYSWSQAAARYAQLIGERLMARP
jgi:glycosyltransferase involved in cell wall biosynthesis